MNANAVVRIPVKNEYGTIFQTENYIFAVSKEWADEKYFSLCEAGFSDEWFHVTIKGEDGIPVRVVEYFLDKKLSFKDLKVITEILS